MRFYSDTEFLSLIRTTPPLKTEEAAPAEPGAEEEQDAPSAESEERPEAERIAVSAGCE